MTGMKTSDEHRRELKSLVNKGTCSPSAVSTFVANGLRRRCYCCWVPVECGRSHCGRFVLKASRIKTS